jgi:hypothetical protein
MAQMTTAAVLVLILTAQAGAPDVAKPASKRAAQPPPADAEVAEKLQLKPDGAGGYRWAGSGFVASIAPDGNVSFKDDRPLPAQATVPVQALGRAIKETQQSGGGVLGVLGRTATKLVTNPTIAVSDAELFRDSHHAAKMSFLDRTARLRERMRAEHDRTAASGAINQLRKRAQEIGSDGSRSLAERHQLLFELWDECADSPAGQSARAAIEDEAARQFPANTPRAFTATELARLNAGSKGPIFSPYRMAPSPQQQPASGAH